MSKVTRNMVSGMEIGQLMAVAQHRAKQYQESWFVFDGHATNQPNGWNQYDMLEYRANGEPRFIKANPGNRRFNKELGRWD